MAHNTLLWVTWHHSYVELYLLKKIESSAFSTDFPHIWKTQLDGRINDGSDHRWVNQKHLECIRPQHGFDTSLIKGTSKHRATVNVLFLYQEFNAINFCVCTKLKASISLIIFVCYPITWEKEQLQRARMLCLFLLQNTHNSPALCKECKLQTEQSRWPKNSCPTLE